MERSFPCLTDSVDERGRCRGERGLDGGEEFACGSGGELNRDPCGRSAGGVSEVNVDGVFGSGLAGVGGFFDSLGFHPGKPMAIVAGTSEAGAGVLLALGLFTPLASAAVIGTLVVAGSVHWAAGLWPRTAATSCRWSMSRLPCWRLSLVVGVPLPPTPLRRPS
jgi:hypothetical protein